MSVGGLLRRTGQTSPVSMARPGATESRAARMKRMIGQRSALSKAKARTVLTPIRLHQLLMPTNACSIGLRIECATRFCRR